MPLTYRDRGTSGTQLDALSGSIAVCNLRKAMMSTDARGDLWEWTWYIDKGPAGWRLHGRAESKPEAQAKIESDWQAWLTAAGLS